jgi:hypothetical protein
MLDHPEAKARAAAVRRWTSESNRGTVAQPQ